VILIFAFSVPFLDTGLVPEDSTVGFAGLKSQRDRATVVYAAYFLSKWLISNFYLRLCERLAPASAPRLWPTLGISFVLVDFCTLVLVAVLAASLFRQGTLSTVIRVLRNLTVPNLFIDVAVILATSSALSILGPVADFSILFGFVGCFWFFGVTLMHSYPKGKHENSSL
jgi:hypothetical protein